MPKCKHINSLVQKIVLVFNFPVHGCTKAEFLYNSPVQIILRPKALPN